MGILPASGPGPGPHRGSLLRTPSSPTPTPTPTPTATHIPSLQPLISRETLKELDLEAILRNPQLRHDLLFDSNLQFRPTSGRRKREHAEKYWLAIQRELESGCTCTSFDAHGRPLRDCVCVSASQSASVNLRMPSRIRPLLSELLEILLSIINPSPSSSSSSRHPHSQSQSLAQTQTTLLLSALDPSLILQQLHHSHSRHLFDPSGLFSLIGSILKCHCAPMRDQAIESMISTAHQCTRSPSARGNGGGGGVREAVRAIRMCFEILELMKLDIANHQLQTLRPFLTQTAPEFELKTFQERHERGLISLHITRRWLQSTRNDYHQHSSHQRPILGLGLGRHHTITQAFSYGLTSLIFTPPSPLPSHPLPLPTTTPTNRPLPPISPLPGYPETLYLDHARLVVLSTEGANLTAMYMLLMLYRQLVCGTFHHHGSTPSTSCTPAPTNIPTRKQVPQQNGMGKADDADMERLKKEIREIGPSRLGLCFMRSSAPSSPFSSSPSSPTASPSGATTNSKEEHAHGQADKDGERWRRAMNDVVLHIAARARAASSSDSDFEHAHVSKSGSTDVGLGLQAPDPQTLLLAERWVHTNLRAGSSLSTLLRDRLRGAVFDAMIAASPFLSTPQSPAPSTSSNLGSGAGTGTGTATGLEPLMPEIRHLGERLAKLAVLHLNVYSTLYEQDGFLRP